MKIRYKINENYDILIQYVINDLQVGIKSKQDAEKNRNY